MNQQLLDAFIGAASLKDYGHHANVGAWYANKRQRNKYLRKHRLGKFANGKK